MNAKSTVDQDEAKPGRGSLDCAGRMQTVEFDEGKLAHSEPFDAVSDWQKYNDVTGGASTSFEIDLAECEASEPKHPNARAVASAPQEPDPN